MPLSDLLKLNNKDLGKINLADFIKGWLNRPDIFIRIILLVTTVFVTIYIYNQHNKETQRMSSTLILNKDRLAIVDKITQSQKELDDFIKKIPESIDVDSLTGKITEYASIHKVQIISFSPADKRADRTKELVSITINILSGNYSDMVSFIKEIEDSPYNIRLESWTGKISDSALRNNFSTDESPVEANLTISAVTFKK